MRRVHAVMLAGLGLVAACDKAPAGAQATAEGAIAEKPTAAAPIAAAKLPAGRSAMPTLDEWTSLKKEVTVKGSSALACETKIVREYLRVSCRGKNDTGGTPTGVAVVKGGRGEVSTYAASGVTSLIVPYVEGIQFEAVFSWTDKAHKLVIHWPRGAPKPPVVGTFEGAASPLDGAAKGDAQRLCDCHKKVTKSATCDDLLGGPDADCERSYGDDCQALLECARMEPNRPPRCLAGSANVGPAMRCKPLCGPGKAACAAGSSCRSDWGPQACLED